jgi:predicted permease
MALPANVRRLFRLVTRRGVRHDVDDELRFHLEMRVDDLMSRGRSREEAQRVAAGEFGDLQAARDELAVIDRRRRTRAARIDWWQALVLDTRYAAHALVRQPLFTLAVVVTLALGIGANTAIFSAVNAVWFGWMMAFERPEQLVVLFQTWSQGVGPTSPTDFRDWRAQSRSFASVAAYFNQGLTLNVGGEPERVLAAAVSPEMFDLLGVRPQLGRSFLRDEEQWGQHRVLLLGDGYWRRRFGADPRVIGRTVAVNGEPHTIVGVLPPGAWFDQSPAEAFTPFSLAPNDPINDRHSHFVWVVARLKDGISLAQATADLRQVAARIAEQHPENQGSSARADPLPRVILGDLAPTLRLLTGAVILVLLVACANVVNLLLVRGAAREQELAIRAALGAGRGRLVRQLLTESVLLALLGGGAGVALALWGVGAAQHALPMALPRVHETGLAVDWRVLSLAATLTLATGVLCGLVPALQLPGGKRRPGTAGLLRAGGRGTSGGGGIRGRRLRNALVISEVALALVLLVGSGLLIRSLRRLERVDTGVSADRVLSVRLSFPRSRTLDARSTVALLDRMIAGASTLPGVVEAGVSSHAPLGGGGESKHFWIEGRAPAKSLGDVPNVSGRMESARSLPAIGATLRRGRWFSATDDGNAPLVAIINEEVSRRFFPGESPIGKRVALHPPEHLWPASDLPPTGRFPRWTIVGVIKDVRYTGLRESAEPAVYVPFAQGRLYWNWGPQWLLVRSEADPAALVDPLRRELRAIDPTLPLVDVMTLRERMGLVLRGPRFTTSLLGVFAIAALVLGAVGLYGVIAYSVSMETRAIGIRLALGADRRDVLGMVLRRGATLGAVGIAIGVAISAITSRLLASELFEVGPTDPLTYAFVALLLIAVALVASYLPARRATRVDPLVALRSE